MGKTAFSPPAAVNRFRQNRWLSRVFSPKVTNGGVNPILRTMLAEQVPVIAFTMKQDGSFSSHILFSFLFFCLVFAIHIGYGGGSAGKCNDDDRVTRVASPAQKLDGIGKRA